MHPNLCLIMPVFDGRPLGRVIVQHDLINTVCLLPRTVDFSLKSMAEPPGSLAQNRREIPRRAILTYCIEKPLFLASTASAPPRPGLSNHDHFLASITTLEPLGPLKVDEFLNGSDDDAISLFMDLFVSPPAWEAPLSCARHASPVVDHSPRTKAGNARRCRRREPAKRGDASTFEKRITSNTYLRRLYLTRQQAVALAPTMARVAEMHDHTKDPATIVSARVAVLDEHDVAHELECKCYLSSREHHFVLCTGWSALSKGNGIGLGDAVLFSRVGGDQGYFQVVCVKGCGG